MAELKTRCNDASVADFLNSLSDEKQRQEAFALLNLLQNVTQTEPKMWGESIIGFGDYHYKYATGREGDWFIVGFSPRKQNLTVYLMTGFEGGGEVLQRLGKHKSGRSCLYIRRLSDIHLPALEELVQQSVQYAAGLQP